jgi:rod shape-determining protein MreD
MVFLKNRYFLVFLIFILLLFDGQISFAINSFFSFRIALTSHLFLLGMLYLVHNKSNVFAISTSIFLGLIFDIYYLNIIGVVTIILPILVFFINKINKEFFLNIFQTLLIFIILIFLFDTLGYLISYFYGMTKMTLTYFITYCLAPTFIFNILMYLVFYRFLKKVYLDR